MRHLLSPLLCLALCGALGLLQTGCSGDAKQKRKNAQLKKLDDDADLLDTAVPTRRRAAKKAAASEEEVLIPTASPKLGITLDGKPDEWDLRRKARTFGAKRFVEEGGGFWRGANDASFTASVRTDENYVYFWIQVRDDVVLDAGKRRNPLDGVALWLHEPRVEQLMKALPEGVKAKRVQPDDVGILFTPDGQTRPADSKSAWPADAVQHKTTKLKDGYAVEVAVKAEVFAHVSTLPLSEIAFRVELYDGDEADRPGVQTVLSMYPAAGKNTMRFATYGVGLLPHKIPANASARPDGMGYWTRGPKRWSYHSFEVMPQNWHFASDAQKLQDFLGKAPKFQSVCNVATHDLVVLEAYQTRSQAHSIALVACATRKTGTGTCPKGAKMNVHWVHLKRDVDTWKIQSRHDVFGKTLPQCLAAAPASSPLRKHFTFFPLEFVNSSSWAVGWQESSFDGSNMMLSDGVALLDTGSDKVRLLTLHPFKSEAHTTTREVSRSRIHFINVDDKDGLDICQIERVEKQTCKRLNANCKLDANGTQLLSHVWMWDGSDRKFEPYMLSKHRNCKTFGFDASARKGFVLMQVRGRIGLMPLNGSR